ncbi:phage portal protein, SPP1 Gp6-like [Anaerolinea thermolimosa]|uniref:phage portal protein n=1 Tax=Anaerolinea thermolimosa TaxID=229919 RepID=UPI0007803386|nr:phage portal protein [Anaerolinea thermolimosa]GAP07118.1 phage portal protein, SPP1 Gp6-like [Anaerolinea thermolimosa]
MMNDLEIAYESLKNKIPLYNQLYHYAEGHPGLKYSTERLNRAFGRLAYFAQDWGHLVIRVILDRLILKGFDAGDESVNGLLDELFLSTGMNLEARNIHESLLVTGEAFLMVDFVDGKPEVYANDPRMCEMIYDAERPRVKKFALKKWEDGGKYFINLYYPDRIEKYQADADYPGSYRLKETLSNPLNEIPVFHFKNSSHKIQGELSEATLSILDAINKLFSDLMVAAEFEAFKMRVFIAQSDPGDIQVGPDMKIWLPATEGEGQGAQVLELGGSSLKNFLEPLESLATILATTTGTPKHYLLPSGSNLSGEALMIQESPLVKKVNMKQELYSPVWQEVAAFLLRLLGINYNQSEISCVWENPETMLPVTEAQTIQILASAGIPLISALRWMGKDEAEIRRVADEKNQEDLQNQNVLAQSLLRFNQQ